MSAGADIQQAARWYNVAQNANLICVITHIHSRRVKEDTMRADAHRQAAEDIEASIALLSADPRGARLTIEGAWGAAFHWVAFGCETKHQAHQESHARLGAFLRKQGESPVADQWEQIDQLRQGGWYGTRTDPASAQAALVILDAIRMCATS